jgi:hypothetical protein
MSEQGRLAGTEEAGKDGDGKATIRLDPAKARTL